MPFPLPPSNVTVEGIPLKLPGREPRFPTTFLIVMGVKHDGCV